MTTLADLEKNAKRLADAHAIVADIVTDLNTAIEEAKRDSMRGLKKAVNTWAELQAQMKDQIAANPQLFVKPRSVVFHGMKLGYRKGSGGIEFDDAEQVVKLIRKHFPEQFDVLVKTKETPVKDALSQLTAAELKRLGVTVEECGDVVFVKPTDSAVDKLVTALLKSAADETEG